MKKTHGRAEHYNALTISRLHKSGVLEHGYIGGWQWDNGKASIGIKTIKQQLILNYTSKGKPFNYPVQIVTTPCNYGGVRYWFECPNCHKRVGKLYIAENLMFECRKCQNLNYATQQNDKLGSVTTVLCRLRNRLNWEYENALPLPIYKQIKPKGMHETTFQRLVARHEYIEWKRNKICVQNFKAFAKRYGLESELLD
ncbi:MAG: hypothetical protein LKF82_12510 [Acinetobacter populi]|jgi:hypothetical protein|uniref:hypothetical protein n=1 Tax=Acinetobacter populi TaxID=1582270 RepID=UPI002356FB86|nr:hypothetical protein [Acinetobacter populi]MCH4248628.1 hypothetical protein [Acinetobacter populi]